MAACMRHVLKAVATSHRYLITDKGHSLTNLPQSAPWFLRTRTLATRTEKKEKKEKVPRHLKHIKDEKEEAQAEKVERKIDNTNRHKPYGYTAWKPVDDVYIVKFYPKPVYQAEIAIDMLKKFQQLDFSNPAQSIFMDLKLDMNLEKKKKVDAFVSTVQLPYAVKAEDNKVVVFTENPSQAEVACANGAAFVGGSELIEDILEDKIQADFYVAVPEIITQLMPLKNKLRKKFPKTKRGTLGSDIPKMLEVFKKGHEYMVEDDCYIRSKIATLDMPKEQIMANMDTIIRDVCSHKPASYGPFIQRALITSATSEALHFDFSSFLPKLKEEEMLQANA